MKSLFHQFAFDDTYGPGTDLAMALLGIFILSTAITKKFDAAENNRLKAISENQIKLINALARKYSTNSDYLFNVKDSVHLIYTDYNHSKSITVKNYEVSQLFNFGESLLFEAGSAQLKIEGKRAIGDLGDIIKGHAQLIEEIQIQGHADPIPLNISNYYKSNLELASARATTVFNFFKEYSTIDPSNLLISIVSYGEFKPLQRKNNLLRWSLKDLNDANDTEEERNKNRRIEIVLIYK